ncbi:MAG: hypothetical protein WCI19_15825 [Betaproteobacteria bacterium]|nr:hypothetical protein [Rhodocyclales bacterium]
MYPLFRKLIAHPALAIGSTLLWGMVELIALQRTRRQAPPSRRLG